jgi:hypothetical protein
MSYNPKFRLKQRVICYFTSTENKPVYGRVIGIKLKRSYNVAGLFQSGGMSIREIESKGFPLAYCDNVDTCEYTVIFEINGRRMAETYDEKELIKNKESLGGRR